VALLLECLRGREYGLLAEALRDHLHQPSRCAIVPALEQMLELRHPDLLGVCLSGSGPSIAALAQRNLKEIAALLQGKFAAAGVRCATRILQAATVGERRLERKKL
jgi:homoserine kinase